MRRLAPKRQPRKIDLEKRLGTPAAKVWQRLPKPVRNVLRRTSRVLRPASGIAFGLVLLAILIAGISRVEAGVGEPQINFYFHNTPGLSGYVMSQIEPSDVTIGTYDDVSFISEGWQEGQRLASGNSTVYLWIMTEEAGENQSLHLNLKAGSEGDGWKPLGTTQWNVNTNGETQFLSISFITEAYKFKDGEQLRLDVIMPSDERTRINWDGNLEKPHLEIPDNSVPLWSLTVFPAAPLMVYLTSWVWKKRRFALRLVSLLIALCVTVGLLATQVQTVGAAPSYDIGSSNVFWFYDDTSPYTYMMYQSQPSGSPTTSSSTEYFYSDTIPAGTTMNAGTSTVYMSAANSHKTQNYTIDVTLEYGSGSTWTSLGSWSLTVPANANCSPTPLSAGSSTSGHLFASGELLRLTADPSSNKVTMCWDGSGWYNNSRLVTPNIVVPEGAVAFVIVVALIPMLTRSLKRRKALRSSQMHQPMKTGYQKVRKRRSVGLSDSSVHKAKRYI